MKRTTVSVEVNGSRHRVVCEQGQEEHLRHVAHYLNRRVKETKTSVGGGAGTELLMLTALILIDELSDAHEKILGLEKRLHKQSASNEKGDQAAACSQHVEAQIALAADRVEQLANSLTGK